MRREWAFFLLSLLVLLPPRFDAAAQQGNNNGPDGAARRNGLPYLIPQTVFVGDRARLVVPLGAAFAGRAPFVLEEPLPRTGELRVYRLELEHRGDIPQLLIDFTAFAPGTLEIPPIPLPSAGAGSLREEGISGLTVNIASILGSGVEGLVLSNPAPPLAAPGALFIIYGTLGGIIFLVLAIIGWRIWSKQHLGAFLEKWRRRRLINLMRKLEGRLRLSLSREDSGDYGEALALLSAEFRSFLGYFSGLNCRTMTAGEFFDFPVLVPAAGGAPIGGGETGPQAIPLATVLSGEYLGTLFRHFDRLRFSGEKIEKEDVFGILDRVKLFTNTLETAPAAFSKIAPAAILGARP